jgi:polar amino acid transport system substrate-binding protein
MQLPLGLLQLMTIAKANIKTIIGLAVIFTSKIFATQLSIVTEHLPPFQIASTESLGGLSTEIVQTTLDHSGYEYSIDVHPWTLSFQRVKEDKNTCIYSLARLPERENLFHWIGHIVSSTSSFYTLKSKQIIIADVEGAKQYKTAVIEDDISHHFLLSKGFVENDNLYAMGNYDALLTLLEVPSRNIDMVIINDDLIYHRVKSTEDLQKYQNLLALDELKLDFHLACSLNTSADVITKLSTTMKALEQEGKFALIRNKWRKIMKHSL